jgi:hypothetical protein
MGLLVGLLAVTPTVFRLLALLRVGIPQFTVAEIPGPGDVALAVAVGTLQDLCVAGVLLIPVLLVARRSRTAGVWTLAGLFVASHLYFLLDLLLYQARRIRMSATFLEFLKFPKPFLDSAWSAGLGMLLLGGLVVLASGAMAAKVGFMLLPTRGSSVGPQRARAFIGAFLFVFGGTVWATEGLPRTTHYASSNIVFRDLFRIVYDRESRWSDPAPASEAEIVERYLSPAAEVFERLDPEYPLLKRTTGFTGPSHFPVADVDGPPPHVVLLFIESFRAADVGVLGAVHQPSVTPRFDALSDQGVLYTEFYGNGVQTTRAVIASLFGVPPRFSRRAVQSDDVDYPLVGLQDVFSGAGYRTAYYHNGSLEFERKAEFFAAHGFEEIEGDQDVMDRHPEARGTSWGVDDEWLMGDLVAWLSAREVRGEAGFLTAFTVSNHHPWEAPPGYEPPVRASPPPGEYRDYLGTVSYSDRALGLFVDLLDEAGLKERVVLVVLGDTSQPMGEHDRNFMLVRHLYEENVRIPLLIWAPGRIPGPVQVRDVGSQVDLPPTLMDIAGVSGTNHAVGTSLRRVVPERTAYLTNPFHLRLRGMRLGDHKYIAAEAAEREALYDLIEDPAEMTDISGAEADLTAEFRSRVRAMARTLDRLWDEKRFVPVVRD